MHIEDPHVLFQVIERVRAIFDLDADWQAIAKTLGADETLGGRIKSEPGLRVPGCWNGFEFAVRALLAEMTAPEEAAALAGRLVTALGQSESFGNGLTHLFPTPEVLSDADLQSLGLPPMQANAIQALAEGVCNGRVSFESVADPDAFLANLAASPGFGKCALQYVALRALRDPDAFPSLDPKFVAAMDAKNWKELEQRSQAWRPWRAYAAMYLWSASEKPQHGARGPIGFANKKTAIRKQDYHARKSQAVRRAS